MLSTIIKKYYSKRELIINEKTCFNDHSYNSVEQDANARAINYFYGYNLNYSYSPDERNMSHR